MVVADAEPPLEVRGRGAVRVDDALQSALVEVGVLRRLHSLAGRGSGIVFLLFLVVGVVRIVGERVVDCGLLDAPQFLGERLVELRRGVLLDEARDAGDLLVADPRALRADQQSVLRLEEHVAASDEVFRAGFVENRPRVNRLGGLEGDAPRNVRLDRPCDDLRVGTLRGEDEVDARRAGFRRQPPDVGHDVFRARRHQVGHLVDDDDDVGDRARHVAPDRLFRAEHVRLREGLAVVVVVDVPDAGAGEELEPLLHFRHRPAKRKDDLPVVRDDGHEQMRNRRVGGEFDGLRIHHDELQLFGRARHQQAVDQRVEADGLALSSRACDEHMGHGREVGDEFAPRRVLSEEERQFGLRALPRLRLEDFAERNARRLAVRHFDADAVFAGNRGLDAERLRVKRTHQFVGNGGDGRVARARREFDRILRDDRTLHGVAHRRVNAEDLERVDELLRHFVHVAVVCRGVGNRVQQFDGRQNVGPAVFVRGGLLVGLCRGGRHGGGIRRRGVSPLESGAFLCRVEFLLLPKLFLAGEPLFLFPLTFGVLFRPHRGEILRFLVVLRGIG